MAYNLESSFQQASDLIHDFTCSPCKDDGLNNEAHFFCDECKKYYCNNCVQLHNKLFRTHSVLGRKDVSKWVGYAALSHIEKCDKHGDKKIELLCEDHDELCCPICVSLTHRMCQSIKHIPDLAKGIKTQIYKKLSVDGNTITTRLQGITKKKTRNKQSLKDSGKKILAEIKALRKKVNDKFDELEKKTNDILQDQFHQAESCLLEDIDKCTKLNDKFKTYLNTIQSQQDDNISYITYKKCKDKMSDAESLLQELSIKHDTLLKFQADPRIVQLLSELNTLGEIITLPSKDLHNKFDILHVFKIKARSEYTVTIESDQNTSSIHGICELTGGEILITDYNNNNLKLLNSQYQVTASRDLPAKPLHLCHIAGYEAAGTKIYITASAHNKLITIDTSGNILSTLWDPDIKWPYSVSVSDRGHVFVGSQFSHRVSQVDKDGKHKLTTLTTEKDGLGNPVSIWFESQKSNLIVGGSQSQLSVFELE